MTGEESGGGIESALMIFYGCAKAFVASLDRTRA